MKSATAAFGLPYPRTTDPVRSATMRAVRQVDTKPELLIRSALHKLGYRFRKDYRVQAGGKKRRVDIAFPTEGLAVFVDGCFWHQCPEHRTVPKSNRDYWGPKLKINVERDALVDRALRQSGWSVLRVWEHSTAEEAAALIAEFVDGLRDRASRRARRPSQRTAVDLFSGAGGSTAGLRKAGYRVLGAVEYDEVAARTYVANHADTELLEEDIRDVDPAVFRRQLGLDKKELGLLNACPPCQGFSTLGPSDAGDERNDLVSIVYPFLEEFLPEAFVVENVPGLQRDKRLRELLTEAKGLGYAVRDYVVNAVDFGVPQNRRRLIAIGVRLGSADALPEHPADLLPRSFRRDPPRIADILAKAGPIADAKDPVHRARTSSATVTERIRSIPVNGDRFDLPEEQQLECHKALKGRRSATAAYGRMRLDRPAPTLTTRCTTPACGRFVHPTEHRGISLREAALIQTFPPRYRFKGTYQDIESQIGNAVPARLATALGLAVEELLLDVEHG
jgi:DNA (cytosine-5)-methyltransferase 1